MWRQYEEEIREHEQLKEEVEIIEREREEFKGNGKVIKEPWEYFKLQDTIARIEKEREDEQKAK